MAATVLNVTGEETLWILALNKLARLPSVCVQELAKLDQSVLWELSKTTGQGGAFQSAQVGLEESFQMGCI